MSNHVMKIDFFGGEVTARTNDSTICLNELADVGNDLRRKEGLKHFQIHPFLASKKVESYIESASEEWGLPKEAFVKRGGRGRNAKTFVHVSVAMLAAEQISDRFHARVHRVFIENKVLEFRHLGGTEFAKLNVMLDHKLLGRAGKDNKGVYMTVARMIRDSILGPGAKTDDWNSATPYQTSTRYKIENTMVLYLKRGLVKDYEHLKRVLEDELRESSEQVLLGDDLDF